jgi:enoyl-CoA hydratase
VRAPVDGLRTTTADGVTVLTLDRPGRRNELDAPLLDALRAALAAADADDAVDVIVLTGAGEHFCGGLDLGRMADPQGGAAIAARVFSDWRAWPPVAKPVIGAINGPVERGGLELALQCDVLLASERATFADTHAALGIVPALGLTALLARAVGRGWALRMSLSGEPVTAAQAARIGLVTEVLPHDELLPATLRLAGTIARNARPAVRSVLTTYRSAADAGAREALGFELDGLLATLQATPPSVVRDVVLDVVRRRTTGADGDAPGGAGAPPP